MEEFNISCVIAGTVAGCGLAYAAWTKGHFRNVMFLLAGFVFGKAAMNVPFEGENVALVFVAAFVGVFYTSMAYVLHDIRKSEAEEERKRQSTPPPLPCTDAETARQRLERVYRLPPADKK